MGLAINLKTINNLHKKTEIMEKSEFVSKLWEQAETRAKNKIRIKRLCVVLSVIVSITLVMAYSNYREYDYWPDSILQPLDLICIVLLSLSFFLPTGKISKEKTEQAFYQLTNEAAQDHVNEVERRVKKLSKQTLKLEELEIEGKFYSEILEENSAKIRKIANYI